MKNINNPIPKKLSKIVNKLIHSSIQEKGYFLNNLISNWKIINHEISKWSKPVSVNFPDYKKINGELTLLIFSGRGPEALSLSNKICEKINQYYGYSVIKKIKLIQTFNISKKNVKLNVKPINQINKKQEKNLFNITSKIKNKSIRNSLINIVKNVSQNSF